MVIALVKLLVGIILVIAGVDLMISKSVMNNNIITGGIIFLVGAAIFFWGLRRLNRSS
jgi:hypothetical protein